MTNSTTNRSDVYSKITDKIVADLEQGGRWLWMRPWNTDHRRRQDHPATEAP